MPTVPSDPFVPTVQPQGQMVYNAIDRATPEAFGGQVEEEKLSFPRPHTAIKQGPHYWKGCLGFI